MFIVQSPQKLLFFYPTEDEFGLIFLILNMIIYYKHDKGGLPVRPVFCQPWSTDRSFSQWLIVTQYMYHAHSRNTKKGIVSRHSINAYHMANGSSSGHHQAWYWYIQILNLFIYFLYKFIEHFGTLTIWHIAWILIVSFKELIPLAYILHNQLWGSGHLAPVEPRHMLLTVLSMSTTIPQPGLPVNSLAPGGF